MSSSIFRPRQRISIFAVDARHYQIFLVMKIALDLLARQIGRETALFQNLDHARRLGNKRSPVSRLFSGTPIILGLPHKKTCVRCGSSA